jgi:hypothetical protein
MKELGGTARNIMLSKIDDSFVPVVEIVLVLTEPKYSIVYEKDKPPEMIQKREAETIRFSLKKDSLEQLVAELIVCKTELEALTKQTAPEP